MRSKVRKHSRVILSEGGPFAREWTGGVEGPLTSRRAGWRMGTDSGEVAQGEFIEQVEVLRLRDCFALRSNHSAQDDRVVQ